MARKTRTQLADEFVEADDSTCVRHDPCGQCGSSDNLAVYTDGHAHCFTPGCGFHTGPDEAAGSESRPGGRGARVGSGLVEVTPTALPKRRLTEATCQFWGYGVGSYGGDVCQVATYHDKAGLPCGQKLRFSPKRFLAVGDMKAATLYGQSLWSTGGKTVIVTEGELDALSMSQLQDHKWPVVSVPAGAGNARKAVEAQLEWLESFERVVFMFDSDHAGQTSAAECAAVLSPGRARIAVLPLKDVSDMLVADRGDEVIRAFWNAKVYRPDGVLTGDDVLEVLSRKLEAGLPYPFAGLNEKVLGARRGELVTICAGSGIGKTLACREIAANLINCGERVGWIGLEENVQRSALGLLSVFANRPLHLEHATAGPDELRALWEPVKDRVAFYDHFGTIDVNVIIPKIRYMARALDIGWIVLDHISIMVSGDDSDERRNLDISTTKLKTLLMELNIGMFMVCHLKRPQGTAHEDGARTSLGQLRGTAGVGQLSNIVLGLERNQQDPGVVNYSQWRVLKNRHTGDTGTAGVVEYVPETGRLLDSTFDLAGSGPLGDEGEL